MYRQPRLALLTHLLRVASLALGKFITTAKVDMKLSSTISYHVHILASDLEDELVMLNLESSHYYGLEAVGKFIWEQIRTPLTVAELVETLLAQFDVERETCEREVIAFLEELEQEGLIQVETTTA